MQNVFYQQYLKAKDLIKSEQYNSAIKILRKILELEPNDFFIKIELSRALIRTTIQNNIQEGRNLLLELLNNQSLSNNSIILVELGKAELFLGNNYQAKQIFERIPQNPFAKFELGKVEVTLRNFLVAKQIFEELSESKNLKTSFFANFELGKVETILGNYDKAIKIFKELLELPKFKTFKDKSFIMVELSRLLFKIGDYDKAKEILENIGESNDLKGNFIVKFELGKIEFSLGNFRKAMDIFNLIYKRGNPKDKSLAMLEIGKIDTILEHYKKAEDFFTIIYNYRPNPKEKAIALTQLLFLRIKEKKYIEAYNLLLEITKKFILPLSHPQNIRTYLEYKCGLISNFYQCSNKNYFASQLFNYNEENAVIHIAKHLDENSHPISYSVFYNSIDLRKLLFIVQEKIQNMKPINLDSADKYLVDCEMPIADFDYRVSTYLIAVTLPNSKEILTMYPVMVPSKEKKYTNNGSSYQKAIQNLY